MSIKGDYATSIRKEIDRYAVWEPGEPLQLGDYGLLHDKTFEKRGNISEFGATFHHAESKPALYEFTSDGTTMSEASVDGSTTVGGPGGSRFSLEFKFSRDHGLVIRAAESYTTEISDLHMLAMALRKLPRWEFRWKIVAVLRTASNATILMSRSANSSVKIEGSADAVQEFKLGNLKAELGLAITGEVGYKMVGAQGPILLDLVHLRHFGRDVTRTREPDKPFERVPTDMSTGDDE